MRCLWCDSETTGDKSLVADSIKFADKEHVFPESVGGRKALEIGSVCQDCNRRLGDKVDRFLKTENFMMLKQYQDSSDILGKPIGKIRDKQDRKRKEEEQMEISGYSGGVKIKRYHDSPNMFELFNLPSGAQGDLEYNRKFSKALHKCAVNVLLDECGYGYLKENHKDMIDFVNCHENESYSDWSYAACYSSIFNRVHFEPFCLQKIGVRSVYLSVVLIFPCGIFAVGTKANSINVNLLNIIGNNPPKLDNWEKSNFDYLSHFVSAMPGPRKTFGGKLKFSLIKNEITGTPNPEDLFYLLTKCKSCGQTNPTGIMLGKNIVLGRVSGLCSANKNSWNYHSKKDLDILLPGENVSSSIIIDFETKYGINFPAVNDVKYLNIINCKHRCINCKEWNCYDAVDCFV